MAEVKTDREHEGQSVLTQQVYNAAKTVGTSQTTVLTPTDGRMCNNGSLVLYNGGTGGALTAKVWVNNYDDAVTSYPIAAASGWAQLGSDITVASGASSAREWTGCYRWLAVTGVLASSEKSDVQAYILLTHH